MWMMLQQEEPQDYVVGIGKTHSVRQLCENAFNYVSLNYEDYVVQDPLFYRPAEVDLLIADPAKARDELGWNPNISFEELVHLMVEADLKRVSKELM
jgi:GDPmannose 4,6-dehydratase